MTDYIPIMAAAAALVVLIVAELAAAVLPVIIIIALVPPEEREALARLLAACDSSRKLRLWRVLRVAVQVRRAELDRTRIPAGISVPRPASDDGRGQRR